MGFESVLLHEVGKISDKEKTFKNKYPSVKGFESDIYLDDSECNKLHSCTTSYTSGDLFGLHVFQTKEIKLCKVVSYTDHTLIFEEM